MEFGKSKTTRFPLEPPANELGPGSYNIASPDVPYKHGAMLERAGRFKEGIQGTDTFGLYDKENEEPAWKKNVVKSERSHQQMEDLRHRLTTQHEKDLNKLQTKLSKVEIARDELVKERNDVRNELGVLKVEVRASTSREAALRSSLDKSESTLGKHVKSVPVLQKQLEALTKDHSDSRKRKEVEITELKRDLSEISSELDSKKVALELETRRSVGCISEIDALTVLLASTRSTLASTSTAAHHLLAIRSTLSIDAIESMTATCHAAQLRVFRLERQLSSTQAQVAALIELSTQLDSANHGLRSSLREREGQLTYLLNERIWERSQLRGDKEWRQRCRSDFRDAVALNQTIGLLDRSAILDSEYRSVVSTLHASMREEACYEKKILEDELIVAEGELDLALEEEIPRLEQELESAEQAVEEALEAQASLQATLEHTEAILQDLKVDSTEMREAYEGELEEARRRLGEKVIVAERLEKEKKRVASLLAQTRAAEQGLREELDASTATLSHLPALLARNAELHATVDELQRRNVSAEHDIRELEGIIAGYDENDNPLQHKIQMLNRVREDLKDSRKAHLTTTSNLAALVKTNDALLMELNGYKSISVTSPDLSTFHASLSRSRSLLPDAAAQSHRSRVSRMVLEEEVEETQEDEELFLSRRREQMENVVVRRAGRAVQFDTSTIGEQEEEITLERATVEETTRFKRVQEGYNQMSVSDLF